MNKREVLQIIAALIVGLGMMNTTWALKSDQDQPATLDADEFDIDLATGVRTYRGNVVYVQGSMRLTCNELVTYINEDGALDKGICTDSPAVFKQRPEGKDTDMVAKALKITMDQVQGKIFLNTSAIVEQGKDTVSGSTITYDLNTEKVTATGGVGVPTKAKKKAPSQVRSPDGRPRLILQPRKRKPQE